LANRLPKRVSGVPQVDRRCRPNILEHFVGFVFEVQRIKRRAPIYMAGNL